MNILLRFLILTLLLTLFSGCGSEKEEGAPLEGKGISKASQIEGTWIRLNDGPLVGLEFIENKQVMAHVSTYGNQYGSTTYQFNILDGGRLSFVGAGGYTAIFNTVIDGDRIELQPERGAGLGFDSAPQQFRKLKKGATLAQALAEQAQELEKKRVEVYESLEAFLKNDDLVLVAADDAKQRPVISFKTDQSGSDFRGTAIMDEDLKKDDVLRPVSLHPAVGSIKPADSATGRLKLVLNIHPATAPVQEPDYSGNAQFMISDKVGNDGISGTLTFPKAGLNNAPYKLERGKLAKQVTAHYEKQKEAREKVIAAVADKLGGRIILSGEKRNQTNNQTEPVELVLERIQSDQISYRGTAKVGRAGAREAAGDISLVLGQGTLFVTLAGGEQWRLEFKDNDKRMEGLWRPHQRTDFISHGDLTLSVESRISNDELAKERAAVTRYLTQDLRKPQSLVGFAEDQQGQGVVLRWPISVELTSPGDNTAQAKMWILNSGTGVAMEGRTAGPSFNLQGDTALEGSEPIRSGAFGRHSLNISLVGMNPDPTFSGLMSASMRSAEVKSLRPLKPFSSAQRKRLQEALSNRTYVVRKTSTSRPPEEQIYMTLKLDGNGNVTGETLGEDSKNWLWLRTNPPGLLNGKLREERGHMLIDLNLDTAPNPTLNGGRETERMKLVLAADLWADEIQLHGWTVPERGNQEWFTLTPLDRNAPMTIAPDTAARLAALRMGAAIKPPQQPKPGDEVLLLIQPTERDVRLAYVYTDGSRYSHGYSVASAAMHAGIAEVDEAVIVRLKYGAPFTAPVEPIEQNGIKSLKSNFRANNTVPTFTIERVAHD